MAGNELINNSTTKSIDLSFPKYAKRSLKKFKNRQTFFPNISILYPIRTIPIYKYIIRLITNTVLSFPTRGKSSTKNYPRSIIITCCHALITSQY